jgi:hypothetical protein
MKRTRRLAAVIIGTVLAMTAGTVWLATGGADAAQTPPGPQPNGVNFTIHSHVDTNFCVVDRPPQSQPASEASMAQCGPVDDQHWTFARAADGSVVIIGGSEGECLDFAAKAPSAVSIVPCTFKSAEHFFYSPAGLIESTSGKKCLQTAAAALNASLSIVKCNAAVALQIWVLGH